MSDALLVQHLSRTGPRRSGDVLDDLGLSSATLHRQRAAAGSQIVAHGRARATTLAAVRPLDSVPSGPLPLYTIRPNGRLTNIAHLQPVEPFGYLVDTEGPDAGFHHADPRGGPTAAGTDLPWFLSDLKPEGHLGRAWLRRHPGLGFPRDLARWSGSDVLRYLIHHGVDLPGALLLGVDARAAWEDGRIRRDEVGVVDLDAALVDHAEDDALHGGGSSPGGEQPKFTLRVREADGRLRHLLVKFTAPMAQPAGRRWADLLVAEHLAADTLRSLGIDAVETSIRDAGGRRFLLVERFDRHGERGRSGFVSLLPFDTSGTGQDLRDWTVVSRQLAADGHLSPEAHARVGWLRAYGHALANTDMHLGNLSLRLDGLRITGLAPVYDMLPMHFAPRPGGEVRTDGFRPTGLERAPADSVQAARDTWVRIAQDRRVSKAFQRTARAQAARLE